MDSEQEWQLWNKVKWKPLITNFKKVAAAASPCNRLLKHNESLSVRAGARSRFVAFFIITALARRSERAFALQKCIAWKQQKPKVAIGRYAELRM